jgi:hypothetical protein
VVFGNGAVATIEVTWTIEPTGFMQSFHLVGTKAQLVSEPTFMPDQLKAVDFTAGDGWQTLDLPPRGAGQSLFDHLLDCIEGKAQPVAGPYDSFKNLQACLAFYEAAKAHQVVHL